MSVKKRNISLFTVILLVAGLIFIPDVVLATTGGSGTIGDPYKIATPEDLVWMSDNIDTIYHNYFKQIDNIDMTGIAFTPIGNMERMFSGFYDGCGRSITGLTVDSSELYSVGLFGHISEATVKNIDLIDVNIKTTKYGTCSAGGVAGWSGSALIQGCSVSGRVESINYTSSVGGIVGSNSGNIENCYSTAAVIGYNDISSATLGGIAGYSGNENGYINNCYFAGSFGGTATQIGGILGNHYGGSVSGNYFLNTAATYGIRGSMDSNNGAQPKTSSEMTSSSTYAGWNSDIWYIADAYPVLKAPAPYLVDIVIEKRPEGSDDVIIVYGRVEGETVSVYSSGGTLIGSCVVEPGDTAVGIRVGKITDSSGSFFVGATTQSRPNEGTCQEISYNIPDAPSTITVREGYKSVVLIWNNVPGATGYKIYKGTVSGVYSYCSTVTNNTAIIDGLINGTEYFFVVTANNDFESAYSNEVSATPGLLAPTDIFAEVNTGTIILSWEAVPGVDRYKVLYGTESGVYPEMTEASDSYAEITGLTEGTEYYFVVRSIAEEMESDNSVEISAVPAAFSFTIPVKVPFYSISLPTGWVSTEVSTTPPSTPISWTCVDGGVDDLPSLSPHNGSGYMVMANTYEGDGSQGSQARFNMNSNLALSEYGSYMFSFYLYIDPSDFGLLNTITPQISTDNGVTWSNIAAPIYTEQPSNPNQWRKYEFSLDSYKGSNVRLGLLATSGWGYNIYVDDIEISEVISVPQAPADVTATAGNESASVSFEEPYNGGSKITGYTVVPYIGTTAQPSLSATGESSPILVLGLTNGTEYTFKVFATNSKGNSIDSSASNAVTPIKIGPRWSAEYPKAGLMGTTTGQVLIKTDSAGKVYYAVMPDNAAAPSGADLKSGTVSGSIANGNIGVTAETEAQINITGLSEKTDYDVYVVAEDNASTPLMQTTVTKVEILTLWNASNPIINTQPSDVIADIGENKNISVAASGSGLLSYQWYKNSIMSTDGAELIVDGTNATYGVPTSVSGTTYYYCIVTNTDNTATGTKQAVATSDFSTVIVRTAVNITGLSVNNKTYDGSDSATLNTESALLSGVAPTDTVTLDFTNAVASFVNENAGEDKTVTISGFALSGADAYKYTLIQPTGLKADISAKELTPSAVAENKVFDQSATATATISLAGIVGDDNVTATGTASFENANAGTAKTVNVTDIKLGGDDKGNYTLSTTSVTTTANIALKETTITMESASFVYDGTEKSLTAASSDGVAIKYTGNNQTEAGTYTVTATPVDPNYSGSKTATLTITKKGLTVAGLNAVNKAYDGSTQATLTDGMIEGIVVGDDVTAVIPASGEFASADVGNDIAVTIPTITLSGEKAGNYLLTQPTGLKADITAKVLTPSAVAENKVFDQSATATATISLAGIVGNDDVTATGTASFENANAGTGKTVNVTDIKLGGDDKGNYTLSTTSVTTTANIALKETTITMESASFVYDGTVKSLTAASSDGVAIKYTGNNQTEAGTYTVTATPVDPNYSGSKTVTLTITKKGLTVAGLNAVNKVYDGSTQATLTGGTIEGIVVGDDVTAVIPASGTFASADVGNDIAVTIPTITLSGEKAGNYLLTQPTGLKANIFPEPPYNITAEFDLPYDGSWTNKDLTMTLNGNTPSGIMKYQYSTDNGENWIDMTGHFKTINETTDEKYLFRAISNGGITSNQSPEITVKVEKEKPVFENILGNPTESKIGEQVISFAVNDTNSGVNKQSVSVFIGDTAIAVTEKDGIFSFTTQGNGQYKINVADYALNTCETIVDVNKIKPMVSSFTPLNNETDVDADSLTITFYQSIKKSGVNGDITLYREDKTIFEKVDIQNNRIKISGNQMKIYFTKPFEANSSYFVNIEKNIISDEFNNTYDGIADNKTWSFKTKKVRESISLIGLEVSTSGERYPAIVDSADETKYTVAAKPDSKGIVEATIYPLFTKSGVSFTVTSTENGIIIDGNKVKITDVVKSRFVLNIEADNSKNYTLVINKGFFDTKIETDKTDVAVESPDLKGAVVTDINPENRYELILNVTNNEGSITKEQKDEISRVAAGNAVLYFDISLILNNVTENTKTIIKNTQNPVTVRLEIPKDIRDATNFKVVRTHDGVIEIIEAKRVGNYLEFTTDRFSQYAITYTKPKAKAEDSGKKIENTKIGAASISVQMPYINGYSDNTFRPDNFISRAETAAILSRLSENYDEKLYYSSTFSDVLPGKWYTNAIAYANKSGFIAGYENGSYMPEREITRAEFAVIIARFNNLTVSSGGNAFDDIKNHWAEGYIMALYKEGLIRGYEDKTFRPDAPISRAEAVKIINAATGRNAIESDLAYRNPFSDLTPMHWAYYEILEAASQKNE